MATPAAAQTAALKLQSALALHQQGRLDQAEAIYREILRQEPRHFDALQLLATIAAQRGNFSAAVPLFDQALAIDPDHGGLLVNRGVALQELGRLEEALASYERALALTPGDPGVLNNRGNVLRYLKRPEEALASYEHALRCLADYPDALNNRGIALQDLGRFAEALASYDRALALEPDHAEAHNNRGIALHKLDRIGEALASYERAIAIRPGYAEALYNRGNALRAQRLSEAALASYDLALAARPGYAAALADRANTLADLKRLHEALASYDLALAAEPRNAQVLNNRGIVLQDLKRYDEALASFTRALEITPQAEFLFGTWLNAKMQICDWSAVPDAVSALSGKVARGDKATHPFFFLALSASAALQQQAAQTWARHRHPARPLAPAPGARTGGERIRVGYFSADFRTHPVGLATAELFETHDRSRFEITAFSLRPAAADDAVRQRIARAFDAFIEVDRRSDAEVVALARQRGIDIAVDLGGFTTDSRTDLFALRVAPLQVGFLGYPGTMGAPYMDYLVADATIVPQAYRQYYSEKIACLPSFQPGDSTRPPGEDAPARAALGLPQTGCVFCCFNNVYKITPGVFDGWARILGKVPGSVLWLRSGNDWATRNLQQEAAARGIDPQRLVFAPHVGLAEHFARHRGADLFLDTYPYNAHSTANDALWAGLPVLTRAGETFASRVGASQLHAIGLPELVTATQEDYESLAIALATDRARLAEIRERLARNRLTAPLFDARLYVRSLEALYRAMHERLHATLPPADITQGVK